MSNLEVPAGFGLASIRLTLAGDPEPMFVTLGVGADMGGTDDPVDVANALLTTFQGTFGDWMNDEYNIGPCEIRYHEAGEAVSDPLHVGVSTAAVIAGARTEDPLPQNCAILVHKRTTLAGRQYRGRMYIPGVPEVAVNAVGALVAGDTLTGLNAAAAAFLGSFEGASTAAAYLLHSDPIGLGGAPAPTLLVNMTVDPIIATQRRRLR